LGELLLSKFKWGKTFFDINRDVLDLYAACKTSMDVVAAQKRHLDELEQLDRMRHSRGFHFTFTGCLTPWKYAKSPGNFLV